MVWRVWYGKEVLISSPMILAFDLQSDTAVSASLTSAKCARTNRVSFLGKLPQSLTNIT
jgi:hypothetical protein